VYYRPYVDRLFKEAPDRYNRIRTNPVTGSRWVNGVDRVGPQKRAACRGLVARAWFDRDSPEMKALPLSYHEREELKRHGGVDYIQSVYARSFEAQKYDFVRHPSFEQYARGVMASPLAPDFIRQDPELLKRYPPRPLDGLGSGLYWKPVKASKAGKRRSG
jgi:hypothetical protein